MPDMGSIQDFHECIVDANLSEISYEGNEFTWCNNQTGSRRICQRLDQVLCNGNAFMELPSLKVKHLQRMIFDHAPLLISVSQHIPYTSRFIFQRMWMDHPNFQNIVEEIRREDHGLKDKLKSLNWSIFGDLKVKIHQLQSQLDLETRLPNRWSTEDDVVLQQCNIELHQALAWDAELQFQKTRAQWLQDGDRNTKFFHAVIQERCCTNAIMLHETDGTIINDPKNYISACSLGFHLVIHCNSFYHARGIF